VLDSTKEKEENHFIVTVKPHHFGWVGCGSAAVSDHPDILKTWYWHCANRAHSPMASSTTAKRAGKKKRGSKNNNRDHSMIP